MRGRFIGTLITIAVLAGAQAAAASVVAITPNPITLEAAPGKTVSTTVNIKNIDTDPLEDIKPEVEGTAFSLTNLDCPRTLPAHDSCAVKVAYRAPSSGRATGQLVLRAGSGIAALVNITGYQPCIVPRLAGLTLPVAKARLKAAGCQLGKVTRPAGRTPKGSKLVVKSASPRAGVKLACGAVKLTLKRVKQRAHVAQATPPAWRLSTDAMTFTSEVQDTAVAEFQIFNDGPGDLVGLSTRVDPPNNRFDPRNACPMTLAAGASCTIRVSYYGGNADDPVDKSNLIVSTDNESDGTKSIALTGTTKAPKPEDNDSGSGC